MIMADFWTFFSEVKLSATKLHALGLLPSIQSLETFWKLCEYRLVAAGNSKHFFIMSYQCNLVAINQFDGFTDDDDEEEDVTDEYIDYLNQKDVIVSAAAKLVAHEIVGKVWTFLISVPLAYHVLFVSDIIIVGYCLAL